MLGFGIVAVDDAECVRVPATKIGVDEQSTDTLQIAQERLLEKERGQEGRHRFLMDWTGAEVELQRRG